MDGEEMQVEKSRNVDRFAGRNAMKNKDMTCQTRVKLQNHSNEHAINSCKNSV